MEESQPPLIMCMENATGEDVALQIEPEDNFQTFLDKAKSLLGFDIDINSITRNQPVSLEDNIYQFLVNAEQNPSDGTLSTFYPLREPTDSKNDLVYILDDGTQIKASQIHFDNDDPPVDLTTEKLPFVQHANTTDDELEPEVADVQKINIIESPVSRWSSNSSPRCDFGNTLPFKVICNNTSGFEVQFTKYLEESTRSYVSNELSIREDYKSYDDDQNDRDFGAFTREEVLNMFKDSPVASLPYENQNFTERKHVRKTDPLRPVQKNWNYKPISYIDVDGTLIGQNESQDCCICGRFIENSLDKLYLFDNEDQRLHRLSPQKKLSTQLKILCQDCLEENFKPCFMKNPNQPLNTDEYLIIKNNQQYIYQRINDIHGFHVAKAVLEDIDSEVFKEIEFSKLQIAPDFEKIIGCIETDQKSNEVVLVKDEDSSDVEIIEEPEIDDIENLEEADEEVKEFLGKYKCDGEVKEMKCRFCNRVFSDLSEVVDHGEAHKHDTDDGEVFPCPLCYYGYANYKWLKGHLKAAHDKTENNTEEIKKEHNVSDEVKKEEDSDTKGSSPIARRTRSADKNKNNVDSQEEEKDLKPTKENDNNTNKEAETKTVESTEATRLIKTEVKQECLDTSDEEAIWIVHTADDDSAEQLQSILCNKGTEKSQRDGYKKLTRCLNCSEICAEGASPHKCQRRGRKRKTIKGQMEICVPTEEDFIRRAQGRARRVEESNDNDLLVERTTKRKNKQPTSDPQIVTCHDCNESFTSKVRLKFHMQLHESTSMLSKDGKYTCTECEGSIFTTETELFDHVHFQHSKQRRWQCPVEDCGKTFYLRATLTKHSRTHTDTRRYVCVTCGKRFLDKQTLDEHGVTHLQIKPFQCHICMKQLTRRSRLRMHLRAHEEELSPTLVLVCAVCNRAFRDQQDAQEHATKSMECIEVFANELKEEEQDPTVLLSPTSGLVRTTVKIVESARLSRPVDRQVDDQLAEQLLSQIADEARSIIRVVEIEKAFRCEYCEDVFYLEDGLNTHRVIHKGVKNPFTCHICKVSFATYSRCTTHKTTHGFYKRSLADAKKQTDKQGASSAGILGYGGFPVVKHFLCEDCGRSYLHWTYLQVHRRMKHANENFLYKCNNCELTFPNSWSVTYHRKKVHGNLMENCGSTKIAKDDYRIPCRDCDEVLPNKTALYKHRKKEHSDLSLRINSENESVWSDNKLYHTAHAGYTAHVGQTASALTIAATNATCNKCGQSFIDMESLEAHFKEVHINEAQICLICDAYFSTRAELQTHARTHSQRPHACSECGHAFRTASMRNEHLRTHTGERPYPCDVCGVAFRRSTAMRNHRLIHTGVRPWACARCPKRFRIRSDLRTHLRLKHPAYLAVIEMEGINPSEEEVVRQLSMNNIPLHKVIEISKISFTQGAKSIVPNSARALSLVGVPRTPVALGRPAPQTNVEEFQPIRRGRGIAKNPRRPKILQHENENIPQDGDMYPIELSVSGEELTDINLQLLLKDGVMVNGNQMVQLQLNDHMLE